MSSKTSSQQKVAKTQSKEKVASAKPNSTGKSVPLPHNAKVACQAGVASAAESGPQADSGDDEKNASPYLEVISKRLRALKKKQTKIEKYEQMDKKSLNAEQIQTLEKKPEVVALFNELSLVFSLLGTVEEEQSKIAKSNQRNLELATKKRIEEAVAKAIDDLTRKDEPVASDEVVAAVAEPETETAKKLVFGDLSGYSPFTATAWKEIIGSFFLGFGG